LAPHLDVGHAAASATGAAGALLGLMGAFFSAGSTVQTRSLTKSETTSSIVLYFSLVCAAVGLCTAPFGWVGPTWPELIALIVIWRERQLGLQRARAAEGPPQGT